MRCSGRSRARMDLREGGSVARIRRAAVAVTICAALSCTPEQTDLPVPKTPTLVTAEGPCGIVPPPPPPGPMLVGSPTDLGECLPANHPDAAVTVQVRVAPDGHAREGLG